MHIMFMPRELPRLLLMVLAAAMFSGQAHAQSANAEEANKSNSPLSAAPGLNFQDYYTPDIYGSEKITNDFLVRGTLPLPPVGFVSVDEVTRKVSEHPSAS
jgi:hypothetical protein